VKKINQSLLIDAARRARLNAHAPYSRYKVGAAVLSSDGRIYAGCNVENTSYGLTVCAERNAVAALVAAGGRNIVAVAVVADSKVPVSPCGACRQVIAEFGPHAEIIMSNLKGSVRKKTLSVLLPARFKK